MVYVLPRSAVIEVYRTAATRSAVRTAMVGSSRSTVDEWSGVPARVTMAVDSAPRFGGCESADGGGIAMVPPGRVG